MKGRGGCMVCGAVSCCWGCMTVGVMSAGVELGRWVFVARGRRVVIIDGRCCMPFWLWSRPDETVVGRERAEEALTVCSV